MAIGLDSKTASKISSGQISAMEYWVDSFHQFKAAYVTEESKAIELDNRINKLNEKWFDLTVNQGQDDSDIETDAYHMKMNLRRF